MIIYSNIVQVDMWSIISYKVDLITYIIKYKFLFFTWYKICQNNPRIDKYTYDGEYTANIKLDTVRDSEKTKAIIWLDNYKHSKNKNNE